MAYNVEFGREYGHEFPLIPRDGRPTKTSLSSREPRCFNYEIAPTMRTNSK